MKLRTAIFDVYGTLLRVGPPPADASARWLRLFQDYFNTAPRLTPVEFMAACQKAVAVRHAAARVVGIQFPEILWPEIVAEVLPEFARLQTSDREKFIYDQIQLGRTTELFADAASVLRELQRQGCVLGIASNAQAYTLKELGDALASHGLGLDMFNRELSFWSFENGFSKPNPHVFRILNTRLVTRGIRPSETLMVGDREDNDIAPARAQRWKTWRVQSVGGTLTERAGDWGMLMRWLQHVTNAP